MALIRPARSVPEVQVAAVAARDPARARAFAEKHGVPRVCASYQALVEDPGARRHLQSAPQLAALRMDAARAASRQARALREADRLERRARRSGWRQRPRRPAACSSRRSIGATTRSLRACARWCARACSARCAASRRALCIPLPATGRHPLPLRSRRRRHHGHRLLCDQSGALSGRGGAERGGRGGPALLARRRPLDARRAELRGWAQRPRRVLALLGEAARGASARDREPGRARRAESHRAPSVPPAARARGRREPQRERARRAPPIPTSCAPSRRTWPAGRGCPRTRATRLPTCA